MPHIYTVKIDIFAVLVPGFFYTGPRGRTSPPFKLPRLHVYNYIMTLGLFCILCVYACVWECACMCVCVCVHALCTYIVLLWYAEVLSKPNHKCCVFSLYQFTSLDSFHPSSKSCYISLFNTIYSNNRAVMIDHRKSTTTIQAPNVVTQFKAQPNIDGL